MMGKTMLAGCLCYLLFFSVQGQTQKKCWVINPQISAFDLSTTKNSFDKDDKFSLALDFDGGTFIADNLALLVGAGFQVEKQGDYEDSRLNLGVGLRYYLFSRLFLGADLAYQKLWLRGYEGTDRRRPDYFMAGAELGYAIFVAYNVALEPAIYWKYSFADEYRQYGLKLGVAVYF